MAETQINIFLIRRKLASLAASDSMYVFTDCKLDEYDEIKIRVAIAADSARASEILHHQLAVMQPAALDISLERREYLAAYKDALQPLADEAHREQVRKKVSDKGYSTYSLV